MRTNDNHQETQKLQNCIKEKAPHLSSLFNDVASLAYTLSWPFEIMAEKQGEKDPSNISFMIESSIKAVFDKKEDPICSAHPAQLNLIKETLNKTVQKFIKEHTKPDGTFYAGHGHHARQHFARQAQLTLADEFSKELYSPVSRFLLRAKELIMPS